MVVQSKLSRIRVVRSLSYIVSKMSPCTPNVQCLQDSKRWSTWQPVIHRLLLVALQAHILYIVIPMYSIPESAGEIVCMYLVSGARHTPLKLCPAQFYIYFSRS